MYSNVSLCGSLSNQQCNFLFQEVVQTPPPGSLLPPVSVSRNLPERNVMQQCILGQTAVPCRPGRPLPGPSSVARHSMPRFFFAFKWADYAKVPLYTAQFGGLEWGGSGSGRRGSGRTREGGARRSNIIHCALRSNCTSMQPIWHSRCVPRKYLLLECGIIWLAGCPIRFFPTKCV